MSRLDPLNPDDDAARPDTSEVDDPFAELAESFIARIRRGELPSLTEYCEQYPALADRIRELFPAVELMEQLAPRTAETVGAHQSGGRANQRKPEWIGDYRILREVGRGGMGIVYEAEQESLGRHVALKVLPPQALLDPRLLQRFQRESHSAARLHHTNIVPVFGAGSHDGLHYIVMQFIQGLGLDEVLIELKRLRKSKREGGVDSPSSKRHAECSAPSIIDLVVARTGSSLHVRSSRNDSSSIRLPGQPENATLSDTGRPYWLSVARIGVQVADALAYANSQGVIHRDIKPSNLLLDNRGTVWVADFGLAKAADSDDLTHTGDIVGTLRYLAPERLRGDSDARSDIYSLGTTLYELLTLRPVFDDSDRNRLIRKLADEEPPRPRFIDATIPHDLETIVLKAIAKDPSDRYPSADELANDLRYFLDDKPIRARRVGLVERYWRWCRRNPLVASLVGLVFMLLTSLAIVFGVGNAKLFVALSSAQQNLTRAESAERDARLREAEALIGEAHGIRYSRREGQRFAALVALKKAAEIGRQLDQPPVWFDRLRNEAIAALALPDVYVTHQWSGWPGDSNMAVISADYQIYARSDKTGTVTVRQVSDDRELARIAGEDIASQVVLSADGRDVVQIRNDRVQTTVARLFHIDSGGPKEIVRLFNTSCLLFRDHSAGRELICLHRDTSISVYDVATGKRQGFFGPTSKKNNPRFVIHPTEALIAISAYADSSVEIRDIRNGQVVVRETAPWNHGCRTTWHPSGRYLCVTNTDGPETRIYAYDRATSSLSYVRSIPFGGADPMLQFNPNGDRIFSNDWGGSMVRVWDFWTGNQLFATGKHVVAGGPSVAPQINFDASQLALARLAEGSGEIGIWSLADSREYRRTAVSKSVLSGIEFAMHPSGRLAAEQSELGVRLVDLPTGAQVGLIPIPILPGRDPRLSVCFDATGSLYTNSFAGAFQWPVRVEDAQPDKFVIGPPTRIPLQPGFQWIATNNDGSVVAQAMWFGYGMSQYTGSWILHPRSPLPLWVQPGVSAGTVAVSPDGRFVAVDTGHVYESSTGKLVWQAERGTTVRRFSTDGRFLLTDSDRGRVYSVGNWEPGPDLGPGTLGHCTADNSLAVLRLNGGVFRLVEMATGRELARLEDPDQFSHFVDFSRDGTQLIADATNGLRIWDLRRIRQELTKLGLDWDAPPYPPALPASQFPTPIEVQIVGVETLDLNKLGDKTPLVDVALDFAIQNTKSDTERQAYELVRSKLRQAATRAEFIELVGKDSEASGDVREKAIAFIDQLEPSGLARELAWHQRMTVLFRKCQWTALAQRSQELQRQMPDDFLVRDWRGVSESLLGDYAAAAEAYRLAAELAAPDNLGVSLAYAQVHLLGNDDDAYRKVLESLSPRLNSEQSQHNAYMVVRTFTLSSEATTDWEPILSLAKRANKGSPLPWNRHVLAMAHLRLGQDQVAVTAFQAALDRDPNWDGRPVNWLGLALAHAHLGHADEARRWLQQATDWMDQRDHEARNNDTDVWSCDLHDRLACRLMRREAEKLLAP